jgi:hypothetical protein
MKKTEPTGPSPAMKLADAEYKANIAPAPQSSSKTTITPAITAIDATTGKPWPPGSWQEEAARRTAEGAPLNPETGLPQYLYE